MLEFEINCPGCNAIALVSLANFVMIGAKAVPTHRKTGANTVH